MAPPRRGKARRSDYFKCGDLVLVKVADHPAWPAKIRKPEDFKRTPDRANYLVQLFGTNEIVFVAPSNIQPFTGEIKSKVSARGKSKKAIHFATAVQAICEEFERKRRKPLLNYNLNSDRLEKGKEGTVSTLSELNVKDSTPPLKHLLAAAKEKLRGAHFIPREKSCSNVSRRTPIPVSVVQPGAHLSTSLRTDAVVARDAFRGTMETLSKAKESIRHATHLAFDCAKNGIANEVIELVIQKLESEPSMRRRLYLFFLVDSITQLSHRQKDISGACFIPLVKTQLPRLLGATAPFRARDQKNHKQCVKVLRLWIERKILPESYLQPYVDALELFNRYPPLADRAVNGRVREIDGMLVDEYGSNATLQLPVHLHLHEFVEEEEETPQISCNPELAMEDVSVHLMDKKVFSTEGTDGICEEAEDSRHNLTSLGQCSPPSPPDYPPLPAPLPYSPMPQLPPILAPSPPPLPPPLPSHDPVKSSHPSLPNLSYPPPRGYGQQYQTLEQQISIPPPSLHAPSNQFCYLNTAAQQQPSESRPHLQRPPPNSMVFQPPLISGPWPLANNVAFQPLSVSQRPPAHSDCFQSALFNTVASRPPVSARPWGQPMMPSGQRPTSHGSWRPA